MKFGTTIVSRDGVEITQLDVMQTQSLIERLCGLLVLDNLVQGQVLWLEPCNSIHTIGMKYPLDLIYLDRYNMVCRLSENVKSWRMRFCLKAKVTMELAAGSIKDLNVQLGDRFTWPD